MILTRESVFEALRQNELILGLSEEQTREFQSRGKAIEVGPAAVLIQENVRHNYLYLVLSGGLEVFLPDTEERFSKVTIARRPPGGYVGEYAFIDASSASASVQTIGECTLFQITFAEIENLLDSDPKLGQVIYRNLLINLVNRLRESTKELDLIRPFA